MARSYNKFDEEYKRTIVELYENGKTISELEREYGVGHSTITNWINKYQKINTLSGKITNNNEIYKLKKNLKKLNWRMKY